MERVHLCTGCFGQHSLRLWIDKKGYFMTMHQLQRPFTVYRLCFEHPIRCFYIVAYLTVMSALNYASTVPTEEII